MNMAKNAGYRRIKLSGNILFYLLFFLIMGSFLFVFFWMVLSSLKTQVQNIAYPPLLIFKPTLENYQKVLIGNPFPRYILNSLIIALGSTGLGLLIGLPAAYSIARNKQSKLAVAILSARMIPHITFLVPWFIVFQKTHLVDTYTAMILTHLIVALPIIIWVMIGFFEDIPQDLEEAGLIDGCTKLSVFSRIVLPIAKTGAVATAILSFIFSWNNFLFGLILSGPNTKTVPVAVFNFMSYEEINWGGLTAAATLITLPVIILVLMIQKHLVRGLTMGAVKG